MSKDTFAQITLEYWMYPTYSIEQADMVMETIFQDYKNAQIFSHEFQKWKVDYNNQYVEPVLNALHWHISGYPGLKKELGDLVNKLHENKFSGVEENIFKDIIPGYLASSALPNSNLLDSKDLPDGMMLPGYMEVYEQFTNIFKAYYRETYPIPETVRILRERDAIQKFVRGLTDLLNDPYAIRISSTYQKFIETYGYLISIAKHFPKYYKIMISSLNGQMRDYLKFFNENDDKNNYDYKDDDDKDDNYNDGPAIGNYNMSVRGYNVSTRGKYSNNYISKPQKTPSAGGKFGIRRKSPVKSRGRKSPKRSRRKSPAKKRKSGPRRKSRNARRKSR